MEPTIDQGQVVAGPLMNHGTSRKPEPCALQVAVEGLVGDARLHRHQEVIEAQVKADTALPWGTIETGHGWHQQPWAGAGGACTCMVLMLLSRPVPVLKGTMGMRQQ